MWLKLYFISVETVRIKRHFLDLCSKFLNFLKWSETEWGIEYLPLNYSYLTQFFNQAHYNIGILERDSYKYFLISNNLISVISTHSNMSHTFRTPAYIKLVQKRCNSEYFILDNTLTVVEH